MVEWKKLGDIAEITIGEFVHKNKQNPNGKYPVYNGGIAPTGFYDNYNNTENKIVISARGATAGFVNMVLCKYWAGNSSYSIDVHPILSSWLFVFYYLKSYQSKLISDQQKGGGIPSISKKQVQDILIPIPSLEEQKRIVGILDTFTASIENLKEQITQRRKQFEHYRDQLLDLEGKEGVEMNSVAHFVKERILANELTAQNYTSVENLLKDKAGRKDAENVPSEGSWIRYQRGDVLIGNIRPYLRKIWLSDREGGTNGDVIVIRANDALFPEFMFYCLASESFFLYYNQALKDGKMPRGEKNRVLSYVIPSIRKEEQSRIVSILDTFEASIANLEAQLSQREKQYEYYRNKLLTFE